jgi:hypothetical protein
MKRFSLLVAFAAAAILVGCGKSEPDLPQKPQIKPDRGEVDFGGSNGLRTCVGQGTPATVLLFNKGKDDLVITKVEIKNSNSTVFSLATDTLPVTVRSNDSTFARLTYSPKAVGTNTATLEIVSNAENSPTLELFMTATAVDNDPICK